LFNEESKIGDFYHLANSLIKGGMEPENAFQILENISNLYGIDKNEIEVALSKARARLTNLAQSVEEFVNLTEGWFSLRETYESLGTLTFTKNNVHQIMSRLVKNQVVERHSSKNGLYRRIITQFEEIDFDEGGEPIDLIWPFSLEKYFICLPRNIVVLSGSYDSGKTCFCLNFALMNMDRFKVNYFSSEMASLELRRRLEQFEVPLKKWKNIRFVDLASNFADAVKENEINIIDFMEIYDEFWKVSGWIADIYKKLLNH
jgi:hypothetical protein